MISVIDYFLAALVMALVIGICAGVYLHSFAAGFGIGTFIMFIGAMVDFATERLQRFPKR